MFDHTICIFFAFLFFFTCSSADDLDCSKLQPMHHGGLRPINKTNPYSTVKDSIATVRSTCVRAKQACLCVAMRSITVGEVWFWMRVKSCERLYWKTIGVVVGVLNVSTKKDRLERRVRRRCIAYLIVGLDRSFDLDCEWLVLFCTPSCHQNWTTLQQNRACRDWQKYQSMMTGHHKRSQRVLTYLSLNDWY